MFLRWIYSLLVFCFWANVTFASIMDVYYENFSIQYDDQLQKMVITGYDVQITVMKRNGYGTSSYMGSEIDIEFLSHESIQVNNQFIDLFSLQRAYNSQQQFIENNRNRYEVSTLIPVIKAEKNQINKYLLVQSIISPHSILNKNAIFQLASAFDNSYWSFYFLFQKITLSNEDANDLARYIAVKGNDSKLVQLYKFVNEKYPSIDPQCKKYIYNRVQSDSYRIDIIKLLKTSELQRNTQTIIQTIQSDSYKIDAIKVFAKNAHLTPQDALFLINDVNSSTYKIDAIKALSLFLKNISSDQYFAIMNSLSSSYKSDALKYLPKPQISYQISPQTSSIENRTSNTNTNFPQIISLLKTMDFDDGKIMVLKNYNLTNLSISDIVSILRCFDYDDGKSSALRLIWSRLAPSNKNNVNQNFASIINTFDWDDGKQQAITIIFR